MRIISGKFKSRRLQAPKNLPVRPTTDMAKEALFNILNNYYYFQEIRVLDLFSGTGNISYEFASRGTTNITCVDANFGCIKYIDKIAKELNFELNTYKSDVFKFLEKHKASYDIIFADPPYNFETEKFEKIIAFVFKNELLNEGGMLVVEHSKHTNLEHLNYFGFSKKYGGNMFSFFEKETSELE